MRRLTARLRALFGRPRTPVIHLYCLCWNEERMLPFFFRHYDPLVARYFVFDNGSTDRSLDMLAANPKVTVGEFRVTHDSPIDEARRFYDTLWPRSRGIADWVFIVNIDEHLYHPDGIEYFRRCTGAGVTVIPATGYEMASDVFPDQGETLSETIIRGVPAQHMDKLCAFCPDEIESLRYEVGRHQARPTGRVVPPSRQELSLLHYKFLSGAYVVARYAELGARISSADRERGWARHYFQDPAAILETHRTLLVKAQAVPGLGGEA